ncbi:hypothetical protein ES705_23727 [subsurface metagenome]
MADNGDMAQEYRARLQPILEVMPAEKLRLVLWFAEFLAKGGKL